ncbi:MAG TPA: S41 family peptidase [Rhodanobacter sp.]|nr:S41 family peptidase [Rhodanobacter sp.]
MARISGIGALLAALCCGSALAGAVPVTPAMQAYDQITALRDRANALVDPGHPDPARLKQADAVLQQALRALDEPLTQGLARGNVYLRYRRYNILMDLVHLHLLQGDKARALDDLDAVEAMDGSPAAWMRDPSISGPLGHEPRYQTMLAAQDSADRRWHARSIATPYQPMLSEAQRIAGLSLFWSEVKYNFVHFDHVPRLDWDQAYLDFLPQVIAARDTQAYYEVLMRLAPLLHDGHTNIYPPKALQDKFYARPPMRTALVDGKVLVTGVFSPTLAKQGIHPGDEIRQIDGIEVHRYASERVAPYESSSTPQDADVRAYGYGLLAGDKARPLHLSLRDATGATRDVTVSRGAYPDAKSPASFTFRMLPGHIAYLSLDHFESEAGVKVFERHLPQILRARGLILDVRRNGGGSSLYGGEILSYLTDRPIPTETSRELRVDPVSRGQGDLRLEWRLLPDSGQPYVKQRKSVFHGPVAVLIGPQTFSAAEDFVVSYDAMKRGLLVGTTTGGSTGQPLMIDLPGGGSARICVKRDSYPDGHEFVGTGIAPDLAVAPDVADIRAGRDPVLARAMEALRQQAPVAAGATP